MILKYVHPFFIPPFKRWSLISLVPWCELNLLTDFSGVEPSGCARVGILRVGYKRHSGFLLALGLQSLALGESTCQPEDTGALAQPSGVALLASWLPACERSWTRASQLSRSQIPVPQKPWDVCCFSCQVLEWSLSSSRWLTAGIRQKPGGLGPTTRTSSKFQGVSEPHEIG